MSTALEQLHALWDQLSPDKQKQALELIQELANTDSQKPNLPPGTPVSALLALDFSLSDEEVDAMERAIMEDRERSIHDEE